MKKILLYLLLIFITLNAQSQAFLPLTGGALTGTLAGTSATFYDDVKANTFTVNQGPGYTNWVFGITGNEAIGITNAGQVRFQIEKFYNTTTIYDKLNLVGVLAGTTANFSGSVGIGTINTQGYKLAVAGNIIAEEVKVKLQGQWPDYVFGKDYPLISLTETQKYIQENKHLPEVPSAKEMEKNGINLSEMNMLLLKKIEELTLHLIEQDNMNKRQNVQIDELIEMNRLLIENFRNLKN